MLASFSTSLTSFFGTEGAVAPNKDSLNTEKSIKKLFPNIPNTPVTSSSAEGLGESTEPNTTEEDAREEVQQAKEWAENMTK